MVWLFLGAVLGVIGTVAVFAAVGAVQRLRERSRSSVVVRVSKSPKIAEP